MGKILIDRKFKRQCSVPGCRSRDTVRIRRAKGYSEQLFICKNCACELYEGLFDNENKAIEPTEETIKAEISETISDASGETAKSASKSKAKAVKK